VPVHREHLRVCRELGQLCGGPRAAGQTEDAGVRQGDRQELPVVGRALPRELHRGPRPVVHPRKRQELRPRPSRDSSQGKAVLRGLDAQQRPGDGQPEDPAKTTRRLLPAGHQELLPEQQGPLREHQRRLAVPA